MSVPSAQATVVTVGAGVAVLALVDAARDGHPPTARRLLGTAVATFGLSALANGAPEVAARLALLWGLSALIVSGGPAVAALTAATKPGTPAAARPAPTAPRTLV